MFRDNPCNTVFSPVLESLTPERQQFRSHLQNGSPEFSFSHLLLRASVQTFTGEKKIHINHYLCVSRAAYCTSCKWGVLHKRNPSRNTDYLEIDGRFIVLYHLINAAGAWTLNMTGLDSKRKTRGEEVGNRKSKAGRKPFKKSWRRSKK